jgi:acetylornithine deacetylase/succinyl-diaminopimelate desuccinylase-like protein
MSLTATDTDALLADCVRFTQQLIRTPSMPGQEADISRLVAAELTRLGYDEVWQDEVGNVFGRIHGRDRTLPALVLNTHLDHVDVGDPALWPAPPFAAEIHDGRILGRGACDIKGPLAVQVYSGAALLRSGERPRRDVVFSGVVEEEVGGAGARYWASTLDYPVALVLVGEPSANNLALGHRGIQQLWVTFHGRSVHASAPERGENPNYAMAAFLSRLATAQHTLSSHPILGPTTVAPTIIDVDTTSGNVTPAWTRVLLDFRSGSESPAAIARFVREVAGDLPVTLTNELGDVTAEMAANDTPISGFYTGPEQPVVGRVRALLAEGMGRAPEIIRYRFATDGRHFAAHGLTVLGFAPGDETLAHTVRESIAIDEMAESLRGHIALLRDF